MGQFVADLAHGKTAEVQVMDIFNRDNLLCNYQQVEGKFKAYDLLCEHCGDTIEVKSDRKTVDTGNVCFEKNLFKFSRANRIVYLADGKVMLFNREKLWQTVRQLYLENLTEFKLGGDGWRNPMILVKLADILPHAELL